MLFTSPSEDRRLLDQRSIAETLTFSISSTPQAAKLIRNAVDRFISKRYPQSDASRELLLALGEALANAIEHGASTQDIIVTVLARGSEVEITVQDHGPGFTICIPALKSLPPCDSERGRGFPIIASCTDSLEIDTRPGSGTRLIFTRKLL
jgi:anti-sigma regulatory factor (Ser/Thr protein kinase)